MASASHDREQYGERMTTTALTSDLSTKIPSLGEPRKPKGGRPKHSNPPVETPRLPDPVGLESLAFSHPSRAILSTTDQDAFTSSSSHTLIAAFIFGLADSVRNIPISQVSREEKHPSVEKLLAVLESTEIILDQTPAEDNNGSRFGNPGFRDFISSISSQSRGLHRGLLPELSEIANVGAIDEVTTYFNNAWGSSSRIDYGSGHELNYLIYLLCLNRMSVLPPDTFEQVTLIVFPRYINLMRKIQGKYYLEPAGSHGVWGLDDYHFLPFLFGASQLQSHPFIRPLSIHNRAVLDAYADDFLYLDMVRHVNSTKTVEGLRWHSPMLDDISGVKEGWYKIYHGMKRMFLHEVIGKLVVMQHFLFGGLLPAPEGINRHNQNEIQETENDAHADHVHDGKSWDDCCGIKVPGAAGAAQEDRRQKTMPLRPLPFD